MKQIEVFDGNQLRTDPAPYPTRNARCAFIGTNAFFQIMRQLRGSMTSEDVMIIFDTKGDFYQEFYRPGDVVISNDETATGPSGPDYWNIFNEIELDEHMEENIVEISKTLFHNKIEGSNQPFFPNAAKDLFSAILTHFTRNKETLHGDNESLRAFQRRQVHFYRV